MTHVLHVIVDLDAGGAERALVQMVTDPVSRGVRHSVLCLRKGGFFASKVQDHGIDLKVAGGGGPLSIFQWILAVRREVQRQKPDVVQGWMYYANLIALFGLLIGRIVPSGQAPKLIWGIRCSDLDFSSYGLHLRLAVWLGARLSRLPNVLVANSHAGRDAHVSLGYKPQSFDVIPNGFDQTAFTVRGPDRSEILTKDPLTCVALTVARSDPMKDFPTLEAAAELTPEAAFFAVGLNTDTSKDLNAVTGLGRRSDIADLLHGADLLVSSSAYGEGMSNSIGEAMASGLPVVATDVGDARRMLVDGDQYLPAGIVVPPREPKALSEAIKRVVKDQDMREAMGAAGRLRIENLYSVEACHSAYATLYRSLNQER